MDLRTLPDEFRDIYTRHLDTIKTRITRGRIRYVYHFLITENYTPKVAAEYLSIIENEHKDGCKINAAFGFILKNLETQELRFFHPSNNTRLFELPRLVENTQDYTNLLSDLEREDVMEYANTQRPSTKWRVVKIVCMRFDVYKLSS